MGVRSFNFPTGDTLPFLSQPNGSPLFGLPPGFGAEPLPGMNPMFNPFLQPHPAFFPVGGGPQPGLGGKGAPGEEEPKQPVGPESGPKRDPRQGAFGERQKPPRNIVAGSPIGGGKVNQPRTPFTRFNNPRGGLPIPDRRFVR